MDLTNSKEKPPLSEIKGKIEYKNVEFYYPSDTEKKNDFKWTYIYCRSWTKSCFIR